MIDWLACKLCDKRMLRHDREHIDQMWESVFLARPGCQESGTLPSLSHLLEGVDKHVSIHRNVFCKRDHFSFSFFFFVEKEEELCGRFGRMTTPSHRCLALMWSIKIIEGFWSGTFWPYHLKFLS